ncbi:hypothetical protein VTN31DRAFT_6104 [Thermomyces dupontii]|uniref:uncharacterized protein n=1 Tax=Talaromyces thermophilus TaxID=28565 RepID=UPI0037430F58
MRLNAALASALLSSATLMGYARAGEAEGSSTADASSTSDVERPTFTPTEIKAPFLEQFTDDWEQRWVPSRAKKQVNEGDEDWAYVGRWAVEEPTTLKGIEGDKGLVLKDVAAHHAISAKFPKKLDNKGKTLVVQYEVKLQNYLVCGGAYLKLLQDNKKFKPEEFSNASPYVIMFGPDKCGTTNKVHFIFRHKNPKTGEYEEKHLNYPPAPRTDKLSHLYTLIVKPDQTFEILIDGAHARNGSLLDSFTPPVNPPKEIDDPKDKKPDDWVDEPKIPDPNAVKPDDWDEDAPYEIPDEDAVKPDDWLDDEPTMIPDPEAEKPEDWDDEEDGDWIPPMIPNPKCSEVSGCGEWTRPMKKNPNYKGKWTPPLIDNPDYKGPWAPRKIPNPNYFEDRTPANFEPIGAVGFELWTMQNDILFDNIYIGHSIEDAEALRKETFEVKKRLEEAAEEAQRKKAEEELEKDQLSFKKDPVAYVRLKVDTFVSIVKEDPVEAFKAVPEVSAALGAVLLTTILVLVGAIASGGSSSKAAKKGKAAAGSAKEKAAEATSSSTDAGKGATKRNTKSSE